MSAPEDIKGPIIVWQNYGVEGWQPKSYETLREALLDTRYQSEWIITKKQDFDVVPIFDVVPR